MAKSQNSTAKQIASSLSHKIVTCSSGAHLSFQATMQMDRGWTGHRRALDK